MLTTATHHFTPMFGRESLQSNMFSNGSPHSQRIQTSELDLLAHEYPLPQMRPAPIVRHESLSAIKSPTRDRHFPYENVHTKTRRRYSEASDTKSGMAGPVRRRISRACDQCNQLRTKCDGRNPCAHCIGTMAIIPPQWPMTDYQPEFGLGCEYVRERKKRGKASRKDLALQQAAAASASTNPISTSEYSSDDLSPTRSNYGGQELLTAHHPFLADLSPQPGSSTRTMSASSGSVAGDPTLLSGMRDMMGASDVGVIQEIQEFPSPRSVPWQHQQFPPWLHDGGLPEHYHDMQGARFRIRDSPSPMTLNGYGLMQDYSRPGLPTMATMGGTQIIHGGQGAMHQVAPPSGPSASFPLYGEAPFPLMTYHDVHPRIASFPSESHGESPMTRFMADSPEIDPLDWLSHPSPFGGMYQPNSY